MAYVSRNNRIKCHHNGVGAIAQPPPPCSTAKKFYEYKPIGENKPQHTPSTTVEQKQSADIFNPAVREKIEWLKAHDYTELPMKTSHPSDEKVSDLALIVSYTGANSARYAANSRAMAKMVKANPRPGLMIFVEVVNPGETAHYSNLENEGWDKVIIKQATEQSAGIFQKEAMWTIGAQYAFGQPGITKCIFLDADSIFDDYSWAYYTSDILNSCGFSQVATGVYMIDQPDMLHWLQSKELLMTCTYKVLKHIVDESKSYQPGGVYACTKEFFYRKLYGHWPYSSLGAGDAVFMNYIWGSTSYNRRIFHYDISPASISGMFPETTVACTDMILMHYPHGPMANRMYVTRDYTVRRVSHQPSSEVVVNSDGLLEWAKTPCGEVIKEVAPALRKLTTTYLNSGKEPTTLDAKQLFKAACKKYYGAIDDAHPLYIVTAICKGSGTLPNKVDVLGEQLKANCKVPYKYIVYTDIDSTWTTPDVVNKFTLDRRVVSPTWMMMNIFDGRISIDPNANILYIDINTTITSRFDVARCLDKTFYMSRRIGQNDVNDINIWNHRMMYFHPIKEMFDAYSARVSSPNNNPEFQFKTPADFIAAYMNFLKFNQISLQDLIMQFDYRYRDGGERRKPEHYDFVLKHD